MRVTLNELLPKALSGGYALGCFNVFGYEDAVAVVRASERLNTPVILATNKEMVEFMGPQQAAGMLGLLADAAATEVCVHLDHCYDVDIARRAVDGGYTSVMYDGSQLPLAENIEQTRRVAEYAHAHNVSVEGEIGSVPYSSGRDHIKSILTDPEQAQQFAQHSGVDAVAVSVGNVHRLQSTSSSIDFNRLEKIAAVVAQPLVIHGTSGINDTDLRRLAGMPVCKFNIGTTLRMSFGRALRDTLAANPDEFDRLTIFDQVMPAMQAEAERNIKLLRADQDHPVC